MTYIEELREVIRRVHGVESKHVESVPIKEEYQGNPVWDGVVEVFALIGHPRAILAYAWSRDTEGKDDSHRHATMLQVYPVISARDAVRAAIEQEFRNAKPAEESEQGR